AWKTGLEGFGARRRRCLDRLADAGLFLELRDAFSGRVAGEFPKKPLLIKKASSRSRADEFFSWGTSP
ncbi:MAG: hypothetical protein WA869_02055, partial [Alloacidobacterium sp.]